jgi:hypothetical protein
MRRAGNAFKEFSIPAIWVLIAVGLFVFMLVTEPKKRTKPTYVKKEKFEQNIKIKIFQPTDHPNFRCIRSHGFLTGESLLCLPAEWFSEKFLNKNNSDK